MLQQQKETNTLAEHVSLLGMVSPLLAGAPAVLHRPLFIDLLTIAKTHEVCWENGV